MKKILSKLPLVILCALALLFCIRQSFDPNSAINRLTTPTQTEVKPDPVILISEIQKLARLETATVNSEQILQATRNPDQLWGALGETMTFVAYGQVIAGIDLVNFAADDISVINSDAIAIRLPTAKIFSVIIDNQKSYVASRTKGILASVDKDMESKIRQQAETSCQENAIKQGIIVKANTNAQDFIRNFLQSFGFTNISFADI